MGLLLLSGCSRAASVEANADPAGAAPVVSSVPSQASPASQGSQGSETPVVEAPTAEEQHRAYIDSILSSPALIEAITLQLSRELQLERAEEYFLEILVQGEGGPRIRDAVQLFPDRVEGLVASGEWRPQGWKEWKWLILTAMREGLYSRMPKSLDLAMALEDTPGFWISAGLKFTPDVPIRDVIADGFRHKDPNNRAYMAAAVCANGYEDYIASVRALLDDLHPWVRANAMSGLVVLDDPQGVEAARNLLFLPAATVPTQERSFLFEALERAAPDEKALAFVRRVLPKLQGIDRVAAESLLILHGGQTDTALVRAELLGIDPWVPEVQR